MTKAPDIEITVEDGICTLRLNRPAKKNALTQAMYSDLTDALTTANTDHRVSVVIIEGHPGSFCAGNDIQDFATTPPEDLGRGIVAFLHTLAGFAKPIVAAVDGLAIGIGTTMLMHCDLVVASDRCRFQTPFVDLGIVPEAASSLLAPRRMGHAWAFELLALGTPFNAERAYAARLVNQVTASEDVRATALAFARKLASQPQAALRASRALLRGDNSEISARIDHEAELFLEHLQGDDAQARFKAFLSKKG